MTFFYLFIFLRKYIKIQDRSVKHSNKNKITLHHAILYRCVLFEPVSMQFFLYIIFHIVLYTLMFHCAF